MMSALSPLDLSARLFALCLICYPWPALADWFAPPTWPELKREIRARFPEVPQMNVAQLQAALAVPPGVVLLDVRDQAEFEVSHLQGAHWAPDTKAARQWIRTGPKGAKVVLYCSVGWRSSALARELIRAGEGQVLNLEGSIFEWANQGLPVVRGDTPVRQVHPYNARWGQLLRPELRFDPTSP